MISGLVGRWKIALGYRDCSELCSEFKLSDLSIFGDLEGAKFTEL